MLRKILLWGLALVIVVAIAQDPSGTGATVHGWWDSLLGLATKAGSFLRSAAGH